MKLSNFIKILKEKTLFNPLLAFSEEEVYSFKPFYPDSSMEEHIIYIGTQTEILQKESSLILNFFCITDSVQNDILQYQEKYPQSNFIFFIEDISKREIFDITTNIFLSENRYNSQINRIVEAAASNQGLQYLVQEASLILDSPIIIIDTSYRVLAMYRDTRSADEFDLDTQKSLGYLTEHNLERMKRDKIYEQLRQSPAKLHYGKASDASYRWLDILVYVHDIEVAEIGIMEFTHEFTHYDFEFINFFKQLAGWEMQKKNFYYPNRGLMHSIFLSELLDQKFASQEAIERRMRMLNWKKADSFRVFTVYSKEQKNFRQKAETFAMLFQGLLPYSHWVITDTNLIFLIIADSNEFSQLGFKSHSLLTERLVQNKMYGILSNSFSDLLELKKYYDQTLVIREFLDFEKNNSSIYLYEDYSIYHIGKILSETHDLKDFYHPAVKLILAYDETNHTKYMDTLREYLTHIDNPAVSSINLCIHKNTFFYRINKIKELFPINLNDGIERMKILLTMEFLKLPLLK